MSESEREKEKGGIIIILNSCHVTHLGCPASTACRAPVAAVCLVRALSSSFSSAFSFSALSITPFAQSLGYATIA